MTETGLKVSQRKFVLPDELVYCPMTTIGGARAELPGHDEDDVLALIEEAGILEWAWDISLAPGKTAREIRILKKCVEHYKTCQRRKLLGWNFERVLKEIFNGYDKPFLAGTRAQLILNCGSTHILNLVRRKQLKLVPGTSWNTGPNGSPLIARESFVEFLEVRKVI